MASQPELVEIRVISGRGLLKIPEESKKARRLWLYVDLLRLPDPNYINAKYPREKGNYANILWLESGYVCKEETMTYSAQRWDWEPAGDMQGLYTKQCIARVATRNLKTVAEALGAFVILSPDEDVTPLQQDYDSIVFECRDGCGISARLYSQMPDLCPDQEESSTPPPNPDPPPQPPVAPGVPLDGNDGNAEVDDPYEEPDDGGDTVPDVIDRREDPPPTIPDCTPLNLTISYTRVLDGVSSRQSFNVMAYAPVGAVSVGEFVQGGSSLFLESRGTPPGTCGAFESRRVNRGLGTWSNPSYVVNT